MPDHQELPPLPEPEVVSYVTDSVMRKSELRTFSRSQVEDIQRQAFEAGKRSAVPAVSGETVEMPEFWSVDVADHSGRILLITEAAVSGRELNDEEMRAVIGAAKHLLAFVGYGLPPCNFDPDTHPTGEVEKDAARYRWLPHVGADEQGNATLEWWCGDRKITMYPMDGMLLKVWGPDCNSDMSEVRLEDADSVRAAFAWLTAAPKQEQTK